MSSSRPPRFERQRWTWSPNGRPTRPRVLGFRGRVFAVLLLTLVGVSLSTGLPLGAPALGGPELTCGRTYDLVKSLLKRHVSFRSLNPELRERSIEAYLDSVDPSKTLFLSTEVKQLKARLSGVFIGMQNDECEILDELHTDLVGRYARMEEQVRSFVSNPEYALDTDVVLILDPEKRGYPQDPEARARLIERLVHFQMSNYLASEIELAEAKEKLIHRYELMTRRAKELESRDVYGNFLNAFAGALDPHSTYYPPEAVEDFEIQMSLSLDGIGVALSSKDGYSVVERIIPGGATDKAKLLEPGDKIIAVAQAGEDPVDIVDMSLRDVVAMIRGERGTIVHLTILRKTDTTERLEVAIKRDKVTIEDAAATLEFEEIEIGGQKKKLAILDLPTFYGDPDPSKRQSGRDVRDLLRQVREAKVDGLLLDLSRNGGGKLESSVEIAGLFIRKGGVVAVKNVFSEVQVLEDQDDDIVYDGPLVILTSRITASASEIVAGALKDYQRAVIVGDDHTFGKGTVQSFVHQPGRLGAIKVTTALFFRPGGTSTQHEGVPADIVLPSLFATDDLGERFTPYSLKGQTIEPFLAPEVTRASLVSEPQRTWRPLSDDLLSALAQRSTARVSQNEEFAKIQEQLAKLAEQDDVIHLAEWIKEREDENAKTSDGASEGKKAATAESDAGAGSTDAATGEPASDKSDGTEDPAAEKSYPAEAEGPAKDEESPPSPQREEAIRILADLVELQESAESAWHVPQSALRSDSPSSLP